MWIYLLLGIFAGLIIGFAATYKSLAPKIKEVVKRNEAIHDENTRVQTELNRANQEYERIQRNIKIGQDAVANLNTKFSEISASILQGQEEKEQIVQNYYDTTLAAAKQNIQLDIEQLEADYTRAEREFQKEYLDTLNEAVKDFDQEITDKNYRLQTLNEALQDIKDKFDAAVEANKRAVELAQQADFYRLVLSDIDLEEIQELRAVAHKLRNSEPLNKVIWKVYYERPYTDMIGRVIGSGIHCGIYKITNIENGMCYVGQAVNIADRWKQHIRRGIGADPPTRNKLYPAMLASGVENFTFEVIEECDRNMLNEREDYWQEFFKAKEFGYSIK